MSFPYRLFSCNNCKRTDRTIIPPSQLKVFNHLYKLRCLSCNETWLACPEHNVRWGRRRFYQAILHLDECNHKNYIVQLPPNIKQNQHVLNKERDNYNHSNPPTSVAHYADDSDGTEADSICFNDQEDESITVFRSCNQELCFDNYDVNLSRFIQAELEHKGDGMKRIVSCAFRMDHYSDILDITLEEAQYHLTAAMFCCSLSSNQQDQFSTLCLMMTNLLSGSPNSNNFIFHPPTSPLDIDRYYLKNSTSIYNNIPIPIVCELHNHACVSIKSVVQHFLFFETNIDGMLIDTPSTTYKGLIDPSSAISSSIACHQLRAKVSQQLKNVSMSPLIIYGILWSDDFEPNNVKQHKKSTWIKTLTLAPPTGYQTSSSHTYVICLGSKDQNHEDVNKHIFNELNDLQSPTYMYCKSTQSNIPVVVQILAISADRPERSALNFMLGHNGLTTKRWRYAAYINSKVTRSCMHCIKNRIKNISNLSLYSNHKCMRCCDWDYDHPLMGIYKPDDYPTNQHPNSPPPPDGREVLNVIHLYPIEITYETLIKGTTFCFYNCFYGLWKKSNVLTYMKSIGINEKYTVDYIYTVAVSLRKQNISLTSSNITNYIQFPIHWTFDIDLDQCIDTPMHHLFQGIMKSVMELTIDWLSRKDGPQYKQFGDYVKKIMSDLHLIPLDWFKMEPFTGGRSYGLGGWQAEQYVAFSRCLLLLYGSIRDIVGDSELGINEFECLIQALHCLICRLMSNDESESIFIMDYVKNFLSCCDSFENCIYNLDETNSESIWVTKGNFLSLLNLQSQIEKFGSIRCYWEGSRERSIQLIKQYLINMRSTTSYYKTKLNHMYVSQTLKIITEDQDSKYVPNASHQYSKFSSFKIYSVHDVLGQMISFRQVISAVFLKYNSVVSKLYICQRNNPRTCLLYLITFNDEEGFNKCGIWYAPIEITVANVDDELTQKQINNLASDYAILCPCVSDDPYLSTCYSVLYKSWKYRNRNRTQSFPYLSKNMFDKTFK